MTTEPIPVTGFHACRHCDALAERRHTWHQCPATGRLELCDGHRLLPAGSDVIDPYIPGEIELSDRLTAADKEYQRMVDAFLPTDDDDVEAWRGFRERDSVEHGRLLGMRDAAHMVRRGARERPAPLTPVDRLSLPTSKETPDAR